MNLRLCGGTYLTLLLAVKKKDANRDVNLNGHLFSLSESGLTAALIQMMNSNYKVPNPGNFKAIVSRYKNCKSPRDLAIPLNEGHYSIPFHNKIVTDYKCARSEMQQFIDTFLEAESIEQMEWLASMLVEVITSDRTITNGAVCCYMEDGQAISKQELMSMHTVFLPGLLLGALDHTAQYVYDNRVGRETIEAWCSDKEFANQRNSIRTDLDASRRVKITMLAMESAKAKPAISEEEHQRPKQTASAPISPPPHMQHVPPVSVYRNEAFTQNIYGGMVFSPGAQVQNINWFGQPTGRGTSLFELQRLRRDYYSLIVLEEETLLEQHFCVPHACLFNEGTDANDRKWLIRMEDSTIDMLLNTPTIFANANTEQAYAPDYQMAMLGKITGIRIQNYDVRIEWKAYCPIQQNLLNKHCPELEIYYSSLTNELDVEHWAVKPIPLLDRLFSLGFNPFAMVS